MSECELLHPTTPTPEPEITLETIRKAYEDGKAKRKKECEETIKEWSPKFKQFVLKQIKTKAGEGEKEYRYSLMGTTIETDCWSGIYSYLEKELRAIGLTVSNHGATLNISWN